MASEQFSSGPRLHYMTPATSSTGLGLNPVSQQPCIPPIRDDWDRLFQPMFDEYFNPPPIAVSPVQEAPAPRAEVLADSPVSTSIDQDAPSISIPTSQEQEHSPIISQGFEESPKTPTFHDDPLNESPNEDSTSHGSSSNVRQLHTPLEHIGRWTKDHPIANVIGDPSRSVSTRKQLNTDAMWCYFDAFLTLVEQICADVSCVQVKTQADWMLLYVVPTGRVVVPTGRYVVPAGKVIIIVSPGRLSLVPTGRILSPGCKDLSRVGSNNASLSTSTPSNSFEFQQLATSLEDKMDIRMS
ncbi:hypothetical protein Tco_1268321, partial [Tanacetum coccineum]